MFPWKNIKVSLIKQSFMNILQNILELKRCHKVDCLYARVLVCMYLCVWCQVTSIMIGGTSAFFKIGKKSFEGTFQNINKENNEKQTQILNFIYGST